MAAVPVTNATCAGLAGEQARLSRVEFLSGRYPICNLVKLKSTAQSLETNCGDLPVKFKTIMAGVNQPEMF